MLHTCLSEITSREKMAELYSTLTVRERLLIAGFFICLNMIAKINPGAVNIISRKITPYDIIQHYEGTSHAL